MRSTFLKLPLVLALALSFTAAHAATYAACLAAPTRGCVLAEVARTTNDLADPVDRAGGLIALAGGYHDIGDKAAERRALDAANAILASLTDPSSRATVIGKLAPGEVVLGDFSAGLKLAASAPAGRPLADALCNVAEALAAAGRKPLASQAFADAVAADLTLPTAIQRVYALVAVARSQLRADDEPGAVKTLRIAAAQAQSVEGGLKTLAVSIVASVQAEAGDLDAAKSVVPTLADERSKGLVLAAVAARLASNEKYDDATKVAEAIKDPLYRSRALTKVAAQFPGRPGDRDAPNFEKAVDAASTLPDESERAAALADVAAAESLATQQKEATRDFAAALKLASALTDDDRRQGALLLVGQSYALAGWTTEATAIAEKLSEGFGHTDLLFAVIDAAINKGDAPTVLKTAERVGGDVRRIDALAKVASLLPK